jgi:alkanesulfonate monooxygenase SsuD/methylene tetrahydromethanopterin reductase-like flavin-dependent oxidoreductase (luciferase family)
MGAGWYDEESKEMGVEFPNIRIRIERLRESVQIVKLLWGSEKATFNGKYYSVQNGICNPKPIQKPGPPVVIGIIKGTKLMPKVAAEVADGVNLTFISPDECQRRIDLVKAACKKVNRSPDDIRFSWQGRVLIAPDESKLKAKVEALANKSHMSTAEYRKDLESEASIIATPEQCSQRLQEYMGIGIDHFMLLFLGDRTLEPLRIFAEEVMQELR